jgi:hypothetical protein
MMPNNSRGHTVLFSLHWPVSLTVVLSLSRIILILAKSGRSDSPGFGVARPLRAAPPVVLAVIMVRFGQCLGPNRNPTWRHGSAHRFRPVVGAGERTLHPEFLNLTPLHY